MFRIKTLFRKTLVLSSLFISASSFAAGFMDGVEFQAHYIKGQVTILCTEGGQTSSLTTTCESSYLDPTSFSEFVINDKIDADSVRLIYKDKRGKTKIKDDSFDAVSGKSKNRFNLWYRTLFQRPILHSGENEITYELSKNIEVVGKGVFSVFVDDQPERYCPNDAFRSDRLSDCRDSINICRIYFKKYNNCL